jgi:hypothetical protein
MLVIVLFWFSAVFIAFSCFLLKSLNEGRLIELSTPNSMIFIVGMLYFALLSHHQRMAF